MQFKTEIKYVLLVWLVIILISNCQHTRYVTAASNYNVQISGSVRYPLDDYQIIQTFGNRTNSGRYHAAEDALGGGGTPVYAIADGVISYSGQMAGYGWLIIIDHPQLNVYSLYGHLSTRRFKVTEGDVYCGQLIAHLADDDEDGSGGSYPHWTPHLHFGIRQGMKDDYPGNGDDRWMAGHTWSYPSTLGWIAPSEFIE
jgi:murein DD-endopeptidase MepM/ murein hydrolase activator NlpD